MLKFYRKSYVGYFIRMHWKNLIKLYLHNFFHLTKQLCQIKIECIYKEVFSNLKPCRFVVFLIRY